MKFITLLFVTYAATSIAAPVKNVVFVEYDVYGSAQNGTVADPSNFIYSPTETCNLDIAIYLIRRMAPVGVNSNVAPFDPLSGSLITPVQVLNCSVDVSEVVIRGLQYYDLTQKTMVSRKNIFPNSKLILFKVKLPIVTATGNYRVKCGADEFVVKDARLLVENFISNGSLSMHNDLRDGLYILDGIQMNDYFGKIEVDIPYENALNGRNLGNNKNIVGDLLAQVIVDSVYKELKDLLTKFSSSQVNAYLDAINTRNVCGEY